jgi:hypothetical protein
MTSKSTKSQIKKVKAKPKASKTKGLFLAPFASNPMRPVRMQTSRDGSRCRIIGTDFLTSVSIGATAAVAGDVLVNQVVNPAVLAVARLATMSKLYERYKFRSLKFRYKPAANATISGSILGYVDYDTQDDPAGLSGVQNLQRAAAHYGENDVQLWGGNQPVYWEIKDVDPLTDLYVDSDGTDPRWTNQGRFVLLASTAIAANTPCGNIYIDYDIEFFIPQLELSPTTGYAYRLTAGSSGCTTSAIFGTTPAQATWSNLPITYAANVFTIPKGSYLCTFTGNGGTVTNVSMTTTGTTVNGVGGDYINVAATVGVAWLHVYATSSFTVTVAMTAASVSNATMYICLLPSDALTLSGRKLAAIERLLKSCGDLSHFEKESKQLIVRSSSSSSSTASSSTQSSVSSVANAPTFKSLINEDYVVVKRSNNS